MSKRVAIVGAGIGGLAAAHRLTELARLHGADLEMVVLEASARAGGALATERFRDALLELGPDTLVTHKPAGLALVERLGLASDLVYPRSGRIDVLHDGQMEPVPAGLFGPSEPSGAGEPRGDESVASRLRRRLGAESFRRWAEPVFGGIYMADLEELSAQATLPPPSAANPSKKALPPLATLAGGLGQIVEALVDRLPPGALRLRVAVSRLIQGERGYELMLAAGEKLVADAVILALPAPHAAALLGELDPKLATTIGAIHFASCATVHLAWPRRALVAPPESFGFFVPRSAGSPVVAASFVSTKYPERVPEDLFVVRAFLGGALHEKALERSDAELVELADSSLAAWLGVRVPFLWSHLVRQPGSMPQRIVGHLERMKDIEALLKAHPGLTLAGGPVGAYGLPDSIAAGEAAAERVLAMVDE